ncbi:MAG: hypothetical protein C4516_08900 [Oxalobacter sp.]|nr:MAG: hypothetical protein C4516_08900 [Oxalobacter sp.]
MRKITAIIGSLVVIIVTLFTSTSLREFTMSPEHKINCAVPISEKLRHAKTSVFEAATVAQWKEIEDELDARMKIRALQCAGGYSPPFYVRIESTKKHLTNLSCFAEADDEMAQWLSIRKVGVLLAKSALKPVPALTPAYIVTDATIRNAEFAANAGIVQIETRDELQIIDIDTQKPILREPKGAMTVGPISANGRVFISGDGDRLKIRDTESGLVVAELRGVRANEFFWLDEASALYNKAGTQNTFITDFSTGKSFPIQAINKNVMRVVRIPQTTNQFAIFSPKTVTKIELLRTPNGVESRLMDEKQGVVFSGESQLSGLNADGNYFFHVGRQITTTALSTLLSESTSLESLRARFAVATPDPDIILLVGASHSASDNERRFLYSISKRTIVPVEHSRTIAQRLLYVSALKRQASVSENKIALFEVLSTHKTGLAENTAPVAKEPSDKKIDAGKSKTDNSATASASAPASAPNADAAPKSSASAQASTSASASASTPPATTIAPTASASASSAASGSAAPAPSSPPATAVTPSTPSAPAKAAPSQATPPTPPQKK